MNFKRRILLYFIAISFFAMSNYIDAYAVDANAANSTNGGTVDSELNRRISSSVNKLMAFGIVEGTGNGQYNPEAPLTREQFTKIMVELLGMGDAVDAAPRKVIFRDVLPDGWSGGYIYLAVSQGIINGYGDGFFKPQEKVTLGEAVTIILRGLGYKDEFLNGEWPNNYILKASELGLLDGIEINKDSQINRGIAALLINNAMEINVIKSYPDGRGYYVTDTSLLEEKQNLYKLERVEIREQENIGKDTRISVEFNTDTYFKKEKYEEGDREDFFLRNEFSSELYIGIEADIYIDEYDKILYIDYDDIDDYENTVFINEIIVNEYNEKPVGKIKLSRRDDYIEISKDCEIYINGEDIKEDDFETYLGEGVFGTFIVEDEELAYADLISWEEENLYIESINQEKEILNIIYTGDGMKDEIQLEDFSGKYRIYLIEGQNKKEITFADLAVGDILNISEEQENKESLIYVSRNSEEGRFERLGGGSYGQRIFFLFKGIETKHYFADEFAYSYNSGKKISREQDGTVTGINKLGEFYNEQVTVYNNWRNEVVYIQGNFKTNSDLYGVLRYYGTAADGKIQIITQSGQIKTYVFEEIEEYDRLKKANNVSAGSIIRYSLGKSNKIKTLSDDIERDIIRINGDNVEDKENLTVIKRGDDFGEDYVIIKGKKLTVDADTAYFDYTRHYATGAKSLKWNKFKDQQVLEDVEVIFEEEDGLLKVLAVWDNLEGIQEDPIAGYVLNQYRLGDKYYVEIQSIDEPNPTQYLIDDEYKNLLLNGRVVLYGINSDNKFKLAEDEEIEFVSGEIESAESTKLYIDGEKYRISDDTQVFRGYEQVGTNKLKNADLVALYFEDGVILTAEILDSEDDTSFEKGTLMIGESDEEDYLIIEIDGEEKKFSISPEIDYVFKDGYLEVSEKSKDITEILKDHLGNDEPLVKFIYNKETDEIYSMWINGYK
ncbi:S-layer homology domain-containing protein [Wukongibacter sp. M2B1]|uniref:S-layer homology domain-containing protein n=1 Tax=Wukongibacter sp. M2B1 TaxID=3088895 RepID=UPI003D78E855